MDIAYTGNFANLKYNKCTVRIVIVIIIIIIRIFTCGGVFSV